MPTTWGLLAEEIDPRDGILLGNFPQALSHVGLVTAVWSIERAVRANSPSAPQIEPEMTP